MDIRDNPRDDAFANLLTPRVEILNCRELAQAAVRRELVAAGATRRSGELTGLLPLARTLGVTVAEIQRLSGFARQTVYTALNAPPAGGFLERDSERLARLLNIALVAAGHEQTLAELGEALHVKSGALLGPAGLLDRLELAVLTGDVKVANARLAPTDLTTEWLRLHTSSRELGDRTPGFAVYIGVDPAEVHAIDAEISEIVGLGEAAILPRSTAPTVMASPELALTVRATDQRSALRAAQAIWTTLGERLGRDAPMRVTDIHLPPTAPNAPSAVLDAFLEGLTAGQGEELVNRLRGEREGFDGGEPERVLAARCLTLAARELRRELGRSDADRVPVIDDGDDAFTEWTAASGIGLGSATPKSGKIRKPLLAALQLAAERLGPFRGGELGSFKAPGARPQVVREVAPSEDDLIEIARLSAAAITARVSEEDELIARMRTALGTGGQSR